MSVVMPVFNRAGIVAPSIRSVLAQTLRELELLVVDDASADDLESALAAFGGDARLRVIRHERNRGVSAARNTGIEAARGRFVAFLDSDDLWQPTKLERQAAAVAGAETAKIFCVTQTEVIQPGGWSRVRPEHGPRPGQSFAEYLYVDGGFAQTSSFFLTRPLADAVRFREGLRQYEDHLFFIECGAAGAEYRLVLEPLVTWHNDERPDRLSAEVSEHRARQFLKAAGDALSERARVAFEANELGPWLWRERKRDAIALLMRAVKTRAVSLPGAVKLAARSTLPEGLYQGVRSRLTRSRAAAPGKS
ncbi:glycosyltransferase [Roseococcus sp. MDT2-1-1]|uniref:Glycosyltransferase n=1 Tax=Sabulicella glaciei TaxID=2984948 RepID=A0ABT3P2U3_9PROT|nr:glycosyltransferase [Roseococcus sp. MDT2-1-1]